SLGCGEDGADFSRGRVSVPTAQVAEHRLGEKARASFNGCQMGQQNVEPLGVGQMEVEQGMGDDLLDPLRRGTELFEGAFDILPGISRTISDEGLLPAD